MSRLALTLASVLLSAATARAQCWSEAEELAPPILADYDAVALCGDTLVLGLSELIFSPVSGTVLIYDRDPLGPGFSGTPVQIFPGNGRIHDRFGGALSLDGDTLAVGAPGLDFGDPFDEANGTAFDPTSGTLYGVDAVRRELMTLDPSTGAATRVGNKLGFNAVEGLAFDPLSGTLYGTDIETDVLLVIDPVTAVATAVGPLGFGTVLGLACDPGSGVLFATDHFTDQLLRVDPATGAATAIGPFGAAFNLGGLAFDPNSGVLYGANYQFGVYTLDPATGAATALGPAPGARGLAFDPGAGVLWGSGDDLLAIDTADGTAQIVGPVSSYQQYAGGAYVFERDLGGAGAWGEGVALRSPDILEFDRYGHGIALCGDTLVVGEPQVSSAPGRTGTAYVHERDLGGPDAWGLAVQLAPAPLEDLDRFGIAVALAGDTAVVSAPFDAAQGPNSGSAFVFERDAGGPGAWGQVAWLLPSDGAPDHDFGRSLAIDGERIVVGAPLHDGQGTDAGAVYVFERDLGGPNAWGEAQRLVSPTPHDLAYFGRSVALSPERIVVGAIYDPSAAHWGGAVDVFERDAGGPGAFGFVQKLLPEKLAAYDRLGYSVALQSDELVALAPGRDAVFRYERAPLTIYCTAGLSAGGCEALISATGTPSASAPTGFFLRANGVEGEKNGLFFFGTAGRSATPWGNGSSVRCTPAPVFRGALLTGGGAAALCNGAFAYDLTARWNAVPNQNPGAGALTQAQFWYRDPFNTSNRSTSLSDAVEFCVQP